VPKFRKLLPIARLLLATNYCRNDDLERFREEWQADIAAQKQKAPTHLPSKSAFATKRVSPPTDTSAEQLSERDSVCCSDFLELISWVAAL
jgi:hypothetical protein